MWTLSVLCFFLESPAEIKTQLGSTKLDIAVIGNTFVCVWRRGAESTLTRGLLSGLVERPDEAPLMDRDLLAQRAGEG